jgi:hypothetical protein
MKHSKFIDFIGKHIHFAMIGMLAIIVVGLAFSLFTFFNSYDEVVQNGMLASIGSINYPK